MTNICCLPARQLLVSKLLRCPILRFSAPQGRHSPLRRAKFHVARGCLGILAQKARKFAKKNSKLQTFSPRRGESIARF